MRIKESSLKFILSVIAAVVLFSVLSAFVCRSPETCTYDRFSVRTLTDVDAEKVNISPKIITIGQLMSFNQVFPVDKKFNKDARYGNEFNTYQVYCKIKEYKKDNNGTYRMILMDLNDTAITMIAEIPNPNCDGVSVSKFANSYGMTRTMFEKFISGDGHGVLSGTYNMTGVCFFDKIKGDYSAPNGVCLSPIVDLEKFR